MVLATGGRQLSAGQAAWVQSADRLRRRDQAARRERYQAPPGHVAGNRTVISLEVLREETSKSMVCVPKHFSTRFNEALNSLTNSRQLGHYDGVVWAP
jgi:hypothetical protein